MWAKIDEIYILTKKIPALITGLLSGNPQLSGSSMIAMTAQTAAAVASGAGTLSAARTAAAAMGTGSGVKGTLTQLGRIGKQVGRDFVMSRSPVKNYRGAMRDFHSTLAHNADYYRGQIEDTIKNQSGKGVSRKEEKEK